MQAFDTKRRVQREIEAGIIKFNQKPKEGLFFLVSPWCAIRQPCLIVVENSRDWHHYYCWKLMSSLSEEQKGEAELFLSI